MCNLRRLLTLLISISVTSSVMAQTQFATQTTFSENSDCNACQVLDPQNAVDLNLTNFSTVEVTNGNQGGSIEQTLIFPNQGLIGDSLVIGLKFDSAVAISDIGNVFFETFRGTVTNNDRRSINDASVNISQQSMDNRIDFYFLTSRPYDRVRVIVDVPGFGGTGVDTVRIFYANKTRAKSLPTGPCEKPIAQGTNVSGLCANCEVNNPENAADADENSFATYLVEGTLFGDPFVEQNLQFNDAGFQGDTVRFFIEDPSGELAANGFSQLSVASFLGGDANNDRTTVGTISAPIVNTSGNLYTIKFAVQHTFDIAQLRLNAPSGLGDQDSLRLYYACRVSKVSGTDTVPCQDAQLQSFGATADCFGCTVQNPNDAVDNDDNTASTLEIPAFTFSGSVFQELEMPIVGGRFDVYEVLISNPNGNINEGDLGNLTIETYLGNTPNGDARSIQAGDLDVVGGPLNQYKYSFEASQPFDRVRLTLEVGGAQQLRELNIFSACIKDFPENLTGFISCEKATSASFNVDGGCVGCSVDNPANVIDNSDASFALLDASWLFGGFVSETIFFSRQGCASDSVKFLLGSNDGTTTPANFDDLTVYFFNNAGPGQDTVGTFTVDASVLSLIPGTDVYEMILSPRNDFDAVQFLLNNDNAGGSYEEIRWYDACIRGLIPPKPVVSDITICYNTSVTVGANVDQDSVVVTWWDAAIGGTQFHTGFTYTTPNLTDTVTYYVEALDTTTGCVSPVRQSITINVYGEVDPAVIQTDSFSVCYGEEVLIVPAPFGDRFNFFLDPAGTDLLFTGEELRIFPVTQDSTIYVQHISPQGCITPVLIPVNIYLLPITPEVEFALDTVTICKGGSYGIGVENPDSLGLSYFWYTQPFGGDEVFNGDSVFVSEVSADTTFWVEAVGPPCGPGLRRTPFTILAIDEPNTTVANDSVFGCPGDSLTVIAQSDITNPTFLWYDDSVGGNLLGTGSPFTLPHPVGAMDTIYVASKLDECEELSREPVYIFNLDTLIDAVPYDTTVCEGDSLALRADVVDPDANILWFDAQTGGNQVATGNVFSISNPTDSTVYWVQVDKNTCTIDRVPVTLHVVPTINLNISTDTLYYCSSDTATFIMGKNFDEIEVRWYNSQSGSGLLAIGDTFSFNPVGDTATVWYEASYIDCDGGARRPAVAIFSDIIGTPIVSDTVVCEGQTVTLTAQSNIDPSALVWYDAQSGGNVLATGSTFTTPALNANASYYVELDLGTNCENLPRVQVDVEVIEQLAATVFTGNSCQSTLTTLRFNWVPVQGAVSYQVSIDGGNTWQPANTGASHIFTNLDPEECVNLQVRSVGQAPCATSPASQTITCCADACDSYGAFLVNPFEACVGDDLTLEVKGDPLGIYEYSFDGGASFTTNRFFTIQDVDMSLNGSFNIIVGFRNQPAQDACPDTTYTADIIIHENPVVDMTVEPAVPLVPGQHVNKFQFTYTGTTSSSDQFVWKFFDASGNQIGIAYAKDPLVTLPAAANSDDDYQVTVVLTVVNENGCSTTETFTNDFEVFQVEDIVIPNGFTPDGDGIDDEVGVFGEFLELDRFTVYNKYGNVVFETNDINQKWDGTYQGEPQPVGVYVYTALVRDELNRQVQLQGTITLIR